MGKKKIATIIVAVVAVAASYNVYQSQKMNILSDLALANVEALAQWESGSLYYVNPCPSRPGNECTSTKYEYPCSRLSYCN